MRAERAATINEFTASELRISANFNTLETNNKLKTSTHVIVEEKYLDDDRDEKHEDSSERIRDGPTTAALEKAHKDEKDLVLSNKNLEVVSVYDMC